MTDSSAALDTYRDQLVRAIARDLHGDQRRARGTRLARAAIPAAGAVAAGALALTLTSGTPVPSADAAILHRVAAELTAPPATILHERALVTWDGRTQPFELWVENVPPYHYHVLKWGHSGTGTAGTPDDPAAELRALVQSGNATVDGSTTVGGVPAYRLTVSGASDRFLNGTAYVAKNDYRPLEIDTPAAGGELIVFETYERLPATAANLQRVNAAAAAASAASSQK